MVVASVEEHSPAEPEDLGSGSAVSQAFSSTSSLKKSLSRLVQKRMNGVKCLTSGPIGKLFYRTNICGLRMIASLPYKKSVFNFFDREEKEQLGRKS